MSKYLFTWTIRRLSWGLKNEVESATVNKSSIFKLYHIFKSFVGFSISCKLFSHVKQDKYPQFVRFGVAPDKRLFFDWKILIFSYFSTKIYIVGTH